MTMAESTSRLASPLAGVQVQGTTRGAFVLRGTLAAAALYGTAMAGPFVRRAFGQDEGGGGMGDIDILNYALTLEYLETEFYNQAPSGLPGDAMMLAQEFGAHEQAHVDALTQTVTDLGGTPAELPMFTFPDIDTPAGFLALAQVLEDTGVSAYNGAAPQIESMEVLAAAGSIVQVEARHAAAIRLLLEQAPAPDAFDMALPMEDVLEAVMPFISGSGGGGGGGQDTTGG